LLTINFIDYQMPAHVPWYDTVSVPALLRHARHTYGAAMRRALEAAGHDDLPKNGLYVIGGLSLGAGDAPLSELIRDLHISKQAAGQLVDALVDRGYLERTQDPHDRRRQIVVLTARGHAAAKVQASAAKRIDARLTERVSEAGVRKLRRMLAALAAIGGEEET
jgi:DNA-binding MarR family transcriptional regulator